MFVSKVVMLQVENVASPTAVAVHAYQMSLPRDDRRYMEIRPARGRRRELPERSCYRGRGTEPGSVSYFCGSPMREARRRAAKVTNGAWLGTGQEPHVTVTPFVRLNVAGE